MPQRRHSWRLGARNGRGGTRRPGTSGWRLSAGGLAVRLPSGATGSRGMPAGREHLERRVPGGDGPDLVVARVGPDAREEDPDLYPPRPEVGAQHRHLLAVGELPAAEALRAPAQPQLAGAGGTQVAHPLGLAARRDEVAAAVVAQQV